MDAPSDPFLSSKLRIGRAKQHLNKIKVDARAFWESRPYVFVIDPEPDGLSKTYKCRLTRPLPADFDFLVIEAIEHMRAALDHLGYATAILAGKAEPKSAYFPIADSAAQLETSVIRKGRCKDIPADIIALFRSLEPYEGGKGNPIWILNKLCNVGKHGFVTSVAWENAYANIDEALLPPGSRVHTQKWNSEKNEVLYFSVPIETKPQYDFETAFFIAFGSIKPVSGLPVLPLLMDTSNIVTNVVLAVEAESRRLGLL